MKKICWLLLILSVNANAVFDVQKVDNGVYALVGELSQRSEKNFGNNSTHGVIVTHQGVILIDSGASYLGALEIHKAIQKITHKKIKIVINTGGQDHRWLGNDYFKKLGALVITSSQAKADQKLRAQDQMSRLQQLIGKSLKGTEEAFATEVFDGKKILELGGVRLELYHVGSAHTQGDIFVYMPSKEIMFAGDIVFNDRMLGIGPARNFKSWMRVFEKMAKFKPKYIVPGHGSVSSLLVASKNTYEYLRFLQVQVGAVIDADGDLLEASKIDQSAYYYLKNYQSIAGKNAGWVFEQLEFDD
jgi:glyoxylase-like metal-dependent hydrolase (beta-lactamase superfamily II)